MTLLDFATALMAVVPETYHYKALKQTDKYIVWAEDGQADSLWADDAMQTQVIAGTVDYFTKTEFDPKTKEIQQKLNELRVSWRLESIQYEDDTGYIHYEWSFELPQGVG